MPDQLTRPFLSQLSFRNRRLYTVHNLTNSFHFAANVYHITIAKSKEIKAYKCLRTIFKKQQLEVKFYYLFFKCWADPRHRRVPFTIIARRVHKTWHSSIEWDVNNTERESFTASIIAPHNERRALGSIPLDGSSFDYTCFFLIVLIKYYNKIMWLPKIRLTDCQSKK